MNFSAYSPSALVLLRPPTHTASHSTLTMIAGTYTRSRLHPLFHHILSVTSHVSFPRKLIVAGVPIPSTNGSSSHLLSSARRPMSDAGICPSTHLLTYHYMFRTNLLDLTRDNRISISEFSFLSSCFRMFVIVNQRRQTMLLLLVDTRSRRIRPPDRLSVSCPPPPHPKGPLIPFLASLSSTRLTVTCSGAPTLPSGCSISMYKPFFRSGLLLGKLNQSFFAKVN